MPSVDFARIKRDITVDQAAQLLGLKLEPSGKQLRGQCPACDTNDKRPPLALTPPSLFYCHHAHTGGTVIDLAAHILGVPLREAAAWLQDTLPDERATTVPQKPEAGDNRPQPRHSFDADKFGASLSYDERVQALGLSQEKAAQVRIGTKRGKLYIPVCPPDVTPAGYVEEQDGKLRLPDDWLSQNIVPFKRPA